MPSSSYTLERPRQRPPPPPLRLHKSPVRPSSSLGDNQLLYDLPTSSSIGSPPGGQSSFASPTSAVYPGARARGGHAARARRPSSPSARGRSVTPQPYRRDEMEQFAQNCHAWYYEQDEGAGREMTETLTHSQASERAQYARIQASIRAAYHAHIASRRRSEFEAHLNATAPGGSLMPACRANPHSVHAKQERFEHLQRFVKAWCNVGMPGTRPFFEGLWAVLRLQLVPEKLGGAGRRRVYWEFDDAVFMESAGKEFMLEAIDVLKGVLGFEDKASPRPVSSTVSIDYTNEPQAHSRSQSEPLGSLFSELTGPVSQKRKRPALGAHSGRSRAPSDPFLDINSPSTIANSSSSSSSLRAASEVSPSPTCNGLAVSPLALANDLKAIIDIKAGSERLRFSASGDGEQLRSWLSPDLSNPEITSLLSVFPSFLTRRTLPRFPTSPSSALKPLDLEEGEYDEPEEARDEVRVGTGVMWLSAKSRNDGWQGTLWERFTSWWRRVFC